ncbi:hypothetical protein OIU85_002298 [Salix viminalis]|uniref:Uncharacterized protein n=1 Tax=Salix viminalis TaxID=40686 RepID=A0A9Q0VNT1_SALVM|nr:hypothetical protein OIU85_002298 [Salix viminalis]
MAKKDKTEIDLEIESLVLHAADCNKNIKRKSYELLLTNKHEAEAIQAEIEALKIFENKGVIESMAPLAQPDDSRANLEAKKEEKGWKYRIQFICRETKDLKKDDSVQEGSVGERREQEKPRIVLGGGDDEERSGDNDKSGQPGMISWTCTVMENAEDDKEKLVPESGEGSEPKEEGYVKLMNVGGLEVKKLKTKKVSFASPESSYNKPSVHTKIKKISIKIRALMHKFKKDQHHVEKISRVRWLNGYAKSAEDRESVKTMKAKTVKLATKLSHMLINLELVLSDMKEMAPKFRAMNSSLKWLVGSENYMVSSRILALLDFVDQEVQSTGILKKLGLHGGNSTAKQAGIDSNCVLKEGLFDENQVNQLILQFFQEILRLDNNVKRQRESDTKMPLKDLTALLDADLRECEKELNKIESRLNELKALCGFEPDDLNLYTKNRVEDE